MRTIVILHAALACGLGSLPGAWAKDIPVYREYTQEIAFYDAEGHLAGYGASAPDVLALQAMRGAKAQEGLMGKETLLEVSFGLGASVFGRESPVSGKLSPPSADAGDGRRRKDEPDRNWLAKSLSLPSLGQTSSNAATSTISTGSEGSGWGWLADELAGSAEGAGVERLPETAMPEETSPLLTSPEVRLGLAEKSPDAGGEAAQAEKNLPEPTAGDRADAALWNSPGGDRAAAPDRAAPPAVAEMSQTRKMIEDISAGARSDFATLRESFGTEASPSGVAARGDRPSDGPSGGWDLAPRASSASRWGADRGSAVVPSAFGGGREAVASRTLSPGASSAMEWQGAWKAQSSVSAGIPSRFGASPDPTPPSALPAAVRPTPSSGGYKPAWY